MRALHRGVPVQQRTVRAVLVASAVSVAYTLVVFGYSLLPSSGVSISGTLWHAIAIQSAFALGTVGVPVFLWLRANLRSPAVLLAAILLFWHVLVEFPPIGSGQGDSPGFLFVFVFAPVYVPAYAALAAGEYWIGKRDVSIPV
ncbi:hypothetical protein Hbl1158_13580 [Halobaculum sp. CBA1158]|uniref:hypothetical protein n=1 Tax=Halobaculum sp. CBA1158 TaxID=2904243 RepID=UPI001F416424|nr:hypothetical protein [Halobaculum sp. CBA1158]UIO99539.1 hypothetical protein Hbl1158_13580 [Halobaculum sp. CBA1158]